MGYHTAGHPSVESKRSSWLMARENFFIMNQLMAYLDYHYTDLKIREKHEVDIFILSL